MLLLSHAGCLPCGHPGNRSEAVRACWHTAYSMQRVHLLVRNGGSYIDNSSPSPKSTARHLWIGYDHYRVPTHPKFPTHIIAPRRRPKSRTPKPNASPTLCGMSPGQCDVMFALAGCRDVLWQYRNVNAEVSPAGLATTTWSMYPRSTLSAQLAHPWPCKPILSRSSLCPAAWAG